MPSKIDKLKLSEKQDRRVKLTTEDKEEIKKCIVQVYIV